MEQAQRASMKDRHRRTHAHLEYYFLFALSKFNILSAPKCAAAWQDHLGGTHHSRCFSLSALMKRVLIAIGMPSVCAAAN